MHYESFPLLDAIPEICAGFIRRIPHLDLRTERQEALSRLAAPHREVILEAGLGDMVFSTAEQVHGNRVVEVRDGGVIPNADGLITTMPGICLGIYVADCAAVYLADRQGRGIALVHSGKKGTELGIVPSAVDVLCRTASISPSDLIAQISPCIRPPHYEIDFAAEIFHQLETSGVRTISDCGICTASHPDVYYSYRREKGLTGRMLAFLAIRSAWVPSR